MGYCGRRRPRKVTGSSNRAGKRIYEIRSGWTFVEGAERRGARSREQKMHEGNRGRRLKDCTRSSQERQSVKGDFEITKRCGQGGVLEQDARGPVEQQGRRVARWGR